MSTDSRSTVLMSSISRQLVELRDSIAHRDLAGIEAHTRSTREMLTELRPLFHRGAQSPTPELMQLQEAVRDCSALLNHVRRTVRALLNVYRSFSEPSGDLLGVRR